MPAAYKSDSLARDQSRTAYMYDKILSNLIENYSYAVGYTNNAKLSVLNACIFDSNSKWNMIDDFNLHKLLSFSHADGLLAS